MLLLSVYIFKRETNVCITILVYSCLHKHGKLKVMVYLTHYSHICGMNPHKAYKKLIVVVLFDLQVS